MSLSEPNEQRICPDCGAALREKDGSCWLCRLAIRVGLPAAKPPASSAVRARTNLAAGDKPAVLSENRAAYQFSLATIMLTITLAAVLLGTALISPGIGFLLVVVVTPAFLRTCIVTTQRKARGESITLAGKLRSFGISLALSFAATLGTAIFLVCILAAAIFVALKAICG